MHVDHLQGELASAEKLGKVFDPLLNEPSHVDMYFKIITACLLRHSAHPPSTEVRHPMSYNHGHHLITSMFSLLAGNWDV